MSQILPFPSLYPFTEMWHSEQSISYYGTCTFATWESYSRSVMQNRQLQLSESTGHSCTALTSLAQRLDRECASSPRSQTFTAQWSLKSKFSTLSQTFVFCMFELFLSLASVYTSINNQNYTFVNNPSSVSWSLIFLLF